MSSPSNRNTAPSTPLQSRTEFRAIASDAQRQELLDCLFAVSAADDAISGDEEAQIWQIASELGFAHSEYVEARMAYSDKRTVFRQRDQS